MDDRKQVRRAERDAWNRLNSIVEDADWIASFCKEHVAHLPVLANLRCGAWYVPNPLHSEGCYFKSTDGHITQWDFSLKRYNLALLYTIQHRGGCVIVDSTRRGKSMPDALSKTVPIWCAVLNTASHRRHGCPTETPLRLPERIVSSSEASQIQAKMEDWVQRLLSSDLPVPKLEKPLRPLFVSRLSQDEESHTIKNSPLLNFHPVVLVSASEMVPAPGLDPLQSPTRVSSLGLPPETDALRRQSRYIYVQGSGDDEEMWSFKLTAAMFWKPEHLRRILAVGQGGQALEMVLQSIVEGSKARSWEQEDGEDVKLGDFNILLGDRGRTHSFTSSERRCYRLIVHADGEGDASGSEEGQDKDKDGEEALQCRILRLAIPSGKRGLDAFRSVLPVVVDAARKALPDPVLVCSQESGLGNDLVGGLVVAILSACFGVDREPVQTTPPLTKPDIKRRLQWITSSLPTFTPPSRGHLLRVNEVLLSGPYRDALHAHSQPDLVQSMAALSSV